MQNYTTENGLALDAITFGHKSALCDKNGNLWFCTAGGGVSRYDGKSFRNFTTEQGLANNIVRSVFEDKSGNLWFGTEGGGVSRYDGTSFTNYTTAQGLANNFVFCITEDKTGNLWFGTDRGGVSRYDGTSFTNFTMEQGLANNSVYSITEDKRGNLWFGTKGGVLRYDGTSFSNFSTAMGLANNVVICITEDKSGNLWFCTRAGGISRYDGTSFSNFTTEKGLANNSVYTVTEDKRGNLWFGTAGGGVSRYDGKSFTNYTTAQGLANNSVYSITEDKTGNLWFGSDGGGVSRYNGKSFTNFTTAQGITNNAVLCINEDKTGNLWFGSEGGRVSRYDGTSFTNFTTAQGFANNVVLSILEDKTGKLWFGTRGDGVLLYDGTSFSNFTSAKGLANNVVVSIAEDKTGTLWFGTAGGGVSRYDGKSFTNFTTAQGLANNFVMSITEDKRGNLWFGTYGGGVSRYDGKYFTNFTTEQGLADNVVLSTTEDKMGILWIGTAGGGVSRYDGKSFLNFTTADGLPDNAVTQVIITKEQNIAIGTNLGVGVLVSFSTKLGAQTTKHTITAVNNLNNQELKAHEPVVEIYNSATGYPVKDVNSGGNCMFLDSKGIIWMATGSDKTALVRFDYKAINKNIKPLALVIQSIKINGETICWYNLDKNLNDSATKAQQEMMTYAKALSANERDGFSSRFGKIQFDSISKFYPLPKHLILPYKHNHISFEFAAIEPALPYLVKYQYILEGYDKEWSPLTHKTEASFGNIYEGTYTFKLKAQSPFGIWSEPISYTFKVLPPWWRTWWMYTVYAIIAVALILSIVWWNGRKLKARAEELKEEVEKATVTIVEQKKVVEEKHKEITDSINYAERIQRALLASKALLDENLNDYFILFKPKDVVSGDFYWAAKLRNNNFALVTADSTGHGVPGAIMSILNISCLEKSVEVEKLVSPNEILNHTRTKIIETLKNDGSTEGGKDGMDGSLLSFDFKTSTLQCASANSSIWIIRTISSSEGRNKPELIEVKADRFPIGKHDRDKTPFTLHTLNLQKGDVVYTLTDGFPDQFGGLKGKKFKHKHLKELLLEIANEPMQTQKQKLNVAFESWKADLEQVDDVCLIGVRL
jgi:ligand-binding sensor domain-containing protein/serine phosphatase RsbU (regulator of sigma subunit)